MSVLALRLHEFVGLVDHSAWHVLLDYWLLDNDLLGRHVVALVHYSTQSISVTLQAISQKVLGLVRLLIGLLVLVLLRRVDALLLLVHLLEVYLLLRLTYVSPLLCILGCSSWGSCWVGCAWHQIRLLRQSLDHSRMMCMPWLAFQAKLLQL